MSTSSWFPSVSVARGGITYPVTGSTLSYEEPEFEVPDSFDEGVNFKRVEHYEAGNGAFFNLPVVGVSHYQANIDEVYDCHGAYAPFILIPEIDNPHDSNAVKIAGILHSRLAKTVGYLPADLAAAYQRALIPRWRARQIGYCPGVLTGLDAPLTGIALNLTDTPERRLFK